jgi:membrane protease YdiL (CAAX protease family)
MTCAQSMRTGRLRRKDGTCATNAHLGASMPSTQADVAAEDRRKSWGGTEALLAWPAAVFIGTSAYLLVIQLGGYSASIPERPGGHLGRAAAQLAQDEPLRDDTMPLIWQMVLLAPGWIALLGISWLFAGALGHTRTGWSLRGEPSDIPLGALSGLLLQVPIVVIVVVIIQAIFGEIEQSGRALALVDMADTWPEVAVLVLFVAVGAPVVEELFYRGLVQTWLVDRLGPVVGIGISSLIFGAVHLSLIELAPLTAVGVVLGVLYWKTGRLLPAIIAHMTFNLFTLVNLLAAAQGT